MAQYDLRHYDGVLAYGRVIRDIYLERHWAAHAWTWHEAADVRVFRPVIGRKRWGDLVWIGNWGDGERTAELMRFLLEPVNRLGLNGSAFGVRYPPSAQRAVRRAGLAYRGWIANARVPAVFAEHTVTVHVPRRPYVHALPGIPTIRPFEALASGIPLVSAPWEDTEGLFSPGRDFLVGGDGDELAGHLEAVLNDDALATRLAQHGLRTILRQHTCAHRVDELLEIAIELGLDTSASEPTAARQKP
jgi:spore maturation protein CgeB